MGFDQTSFTMINQFPFVLYIFHKSLITSDTHFINNKYDSLHTFYVSVENRQPIKF